MRRTNFRVLTIVFVCTVGLWCIFLLTGFVDRLGNVGLDLLFRIRGEVLPKLKAVIVSIDDVSIDFIGEWPFSRDIYAYVIKNLADMGAKVIAFDVFFDVEREGDDALAEAVDYAISKGVRVFFAAYLTEEGGVQKWGLPLEKFIRGDNWGFVTLPQDFDGYVRRAMLLLDCPLTGKDEPSMDAKVALSLGAKGVPPAILINYYGPSGTFPEVPIAFAADRGIVGDDAYKEMFKGAVVYVGATTPTLHDEFFVPFSRWTRRPMPGVEIHLHILSNLLNREWLGSLPRPFGIGISFVALLLGFVWGYLFSERRVVAVWLAAFIAGMWVASIALFNSRIFLDPLGPSLSGLMGFFPSVATRAIVEAVEKERIRRMFARYLGPEVSDELLKDPDALKIGGRSCEIAVFFADIRGFTSFSEKRDPEEALKVCNQYLTVMARRILENGGTLDKYTGDGVMAFFGAPRRLGNPALSAARAALQIIEDAKELEKKYGLRVGIGGAFGKAVVGNVGTDFRSDYTAIGDTVNTAARLEKVAGPFEFVVNEGFAKALEGVADLKELPPQSLKGKEKPVRVFLVLRLKEEERGEAA